MSRPCSLPVGHYVSHATCIVRPTARIWFRYNKRHKAANDQGGNKYALRARHRQRQIKPANGSMPSLLVFVVSCQGRGTPSKLHFFTRPAADCKNNDLHLLIYAHGIPDDRGGLRYHTSLTVLRKTHPQGGRAGPHSSCTCCNCLLDDLTHLIGVFLSAQV